MIIIFKIAAVLLGLIAVAKSYLDYRRKYEPFIVFIFWTLVWVGSTILVAYPVLIEWFSQYTKDNSLTIGSMTSFAFIFLLYIVYRTYIKAARLERLLTELIRAQALTDTKVSSKETK